MRRGPFKGEHPPLPAPAFPGERPAPPPPLHDDIIPAFRLAARPVRHAVPAPPPPPPPPRPVSFPRCSRPIGQPRWRSPAPLCSDWPEPGACRRSREARGGRFRGCEAPVGGGEAGGCGARGRRGARRTGGRRRLRQGQAGSERDGTVTRWVRIAGSSRQPPSDLRLQGQRKAGVGARARRRGPAPARVSRRRPDFSSGAAVGVCGRVGGGRGGSACPLTLPPTFPVRSRSSSPHRRSRVGGRCPVRLDSSAPLLGASPHRGTAAASSRGPASPPQKPPRSFPLGPWDRFLPRSGLSPPPRAPRGARFPSLVPNAWRLVGRRWFFSVLSHRFL